MGWVACAALLYVHLFALLVLLRLRVRLLLRKSKSKSKSKSKKLSIVTHELGPTPAVGSNPTPGDFWVEIFGVGCLPTPGIKSLVWDPTPRTPVWDWKHDRR